MIESKIITIKNCYDSHVHWLETGRQTRLIDLRSLTRPQELTRFLTADSPDQEGWVIGFGWDQNRWHPNEEPPTRHHIDQIISNKPVLLWRTDRHAAWVNSAALIRAGYLTQQGAASDLSRVDPPGGRIQRDSAGLPTGLLIDTAINPVSDAEPEFSNQSLRTLLLEGMRRLNQAGFTHIRDLGGSEAEWNSKISIEKELTLAAEQFFPMYDLNSFNSVLELTKKAKATKHQKLRVCGIKIFCDGALGSEGAWVSTPYRSGSGVGLSLLTDDQLTDVMRQTFSSHLDLAVHAIGDEAFDQVSRCYHALWEKGSSGKLHIEHVEIARPESIARLRGKDVVCHMQPCHFLSDRHWLYQKVPDLKNHFFPWQQVASQAIPLFFGSDTPIERPSLKDNADAIQSAQEMSIRPPPQQSLFYQQHPDPSWLPDTYTCLNNDFEITEVHFGGKRLI